MKLCSAVVLAGFPTEGGWGWLFDAAQPIKKGLGQRCDVSFPDLIKVNCGWNQKGKSSSIPRGIGSNCSKHGSSFIKSINASLYRSQRASAWSLRDFHKSQAVSISRWVWGVLIFPPLPPFSFLSWIVSWASWLGLSRMVPQY